MQHSTRVASFLRSKIFGKSSFLLIPAIIMCAFFANFALAAGGLVTVTAANPAVSVSADLAGGSGIDVGMITMTESSYGGFQPGIVTLTAPSGFEFIVTSSAHVIINGDSNSSYNINNAANGSFHSVSSSASVITFRVTDASASDKSGSLIWSGIYVKPIAGTPLSTGSIVVGGSSVASLSNASPIVLTEVAGAPSAANSSFACVPSVGILAGGSTSCTANVKDQFNNPVAGASVNLIASGVNTTFNHNPDLTNVNGQATVEVRSNTAQTETITATINGVLPLTPVSITFIASAAAVGTISAATITPEASLAGTPVAVTITVTDSFGNPVNNFDVTLDAAFTPSASGLGSIAISGAGKTQGTGQTTRIVTGYNVGTVALSINGVVAAGDKTIKFIDTTKPVISRTGDAVVSTEYRGIYTDLGATAADNIDGDITAHIVAVNPVSTSIVVNNPALAGKIVASYSVTYDVVDSSDNHADQVTRTVNVIDTTAPVLTALTSDATAAGVLKIGDKINFILTSDPAEPIASVSGSYNGQTLSWTTADAGATYLATYTVAAGESDQIAPLQISGVIMADEAGNVSSAIAGTDIAKTIDANVPVISSVDLPAYINIANKSAIALAVVGEANAALSYSINDEDALTADINGTGVIDASGNFSAAGLDLSALSDGMITVSVTISDAAGNNSLVSTDAAIKDTVAPAAPIAQLPPYINTLNQASPTISGTGEAAAVIAYTVTDSLSAAVSGSGAVAADGSIDIAGADLTALVDGPIFFSMNLTDAAGNTGSDGLSTSTKETVKPALVSLDNSALYKSGTSTLTAVFSETVTAPKIAIAYSGVSGTCADVAPTLMSATADGKTFIYGLAISEDCDAASGAITISDATDVAGNIIDADSTHSFAIDTLAPVFSATTPATDAFIKADYVVGYTLSEALQSGSISFADGSITQTYNLSGADLAAGAHSISASTLGFALVDGQKYSVKFNGADLAGNDAVESVNSNITYDIAVPTVVNVTSDKADGAYKAGENILVKVEFSEPVNVGTYYRPAGCGYYSWSPCLDAIDQRPYLTLETGDTDRNAAYDSGTGSSTVYFSYTVQSGDRSLDLDYIASGALNMNGQYIRDLAGNDVNAALPAVGMENSLSFNKDIKIDAVAPVIAAHAEVVAEAASASGAIVTFIDPAADDVFDGTLAVACAPASGSQFAIGDTVVTCSVADALGNGSVSTFNVHVHDTTAPTITAPADVSGFVANGWLSTVPLGAPSASDIVDADLTITNDAPAGFPVGTTVVTWTATDDYGNSASAAQNVTVVPAPIEKLSLTAVSPLTTAETSLITVVGKDHWNHIVTNNSETQVVLTADNGGALASSLLALLNGQATTGLTKTAPGIVNVTALSGTGNYLLPDTKQVEFTSADVIAPYVVSMSPANGATGVAINAPLFLIFSEVLDADTVTSGNVKLMKVSSDEETEDAQVAAVVSLAEGGKRVNITPVGNLDYAPAHYYFVISALADKSGNVMTALIGKDNSGFDTAENTADLTAPTVVGQSPLADSADVALEAKPYIDFSESMKAATLISANIELRKSSDNSVVPASISIENGGTRAVINPSSNLDLAASYYIAVNTSVTDEAGNALAVAYSGGSFTTIADNTVLSVTGISAVKSYASADGSWDNGWKWVFDITAPSDESRLRMKFADLISGTNVIPAAGNIRYFSEQSSGNNSEESAIEIAEANAYASAMFLNGDLDASKLGRQIKVIVEARVPEGTVGGSYSTSYGVDTYIDEEN